MIHGNGIFIVYNLKTLHVQIVCTKQLPDGDHFHICNRICISILKSSQSQKEHSEFVTHN
jgi:hypothetical protein